MHEATTDCKSQIFKDVLQVLLCTHLSTIKLERITDGSYHPSLSIALTSQPNATRYLTTSRWPLQTALCRALKPFSVLWFGLGICKEKQISHNSNTPFQHFTGWSFQFIQKHFITVCQCVLLTTHPNNLYKTSIMLTIYMTLHNIQ